jgi:DNA-binding transcriptional LysR family regulator
MDVRHVQQVLAVHRHRGFVKAAAELGISQPALSRSIARLEDQLRIKLFERSQTGAIATPLGLALIQRGERMVIEAQRLRRDIELLAIGQIGEVRVGVGPSLQPALPELAVALSSAFPRLRVSLNADKRHTLVAGLKSGRLDIVAAVAGPDLDEPELQATPIMIERLVAAARPGHPLVGRPKISLDEFVTHPTVGLFEDQLFHAVDPSLRLTRGSDPPPAFVTQDTGAILALLTRSGLTYIGSEHTVSPWLAAGQAALINLEWRWELVLNVVMTRAATHSPVIVHCSTLIADVCRRVLTPRRDASRDLE